jgi:hypothetical protein
MAADTRRIYVASSWRNDMQLGVVHVLRQAGHEVYDFRNPTEGDAGFHWSDIAPNWQSATPEGFDRMLDHPIAQAGFKRDMDALMWCDTCVLVQPCGRSAHLELGWAVGAGKETILLLQEGEPELMYRMVNHRVCNVMDMLDIVGTPAYV